MQSTIPYTLVVDDNPIDRRVIRAMLEKMKIFDVQEAEDGRVANAKMDTAAKTGRPFALVILDWHMPNMGGHKTLLTIRQSESGKNSKVIVMTATAEKEVVESALSVGANSFVVKPVDFENLSSKIKAFFPVTVQQ